MDRGCFTLCDEQDSSVDASVFSSQHERGVVLCGSRDFGSVMAKREEQMDDFGETSFGGQVKRSVGFVGIVGVVEEERVVLEDAVHEEHVVEENRSAETR